MKKLLAIALIAVLALTLVACGGGKIKDGTYTAEFKNVSLGWRDTLAVTYKDGAVTSAAYDAIDKDGKLKSSLTDEKYGMVDPMPALSKWMPMLNENVVKSAGDAEKLEAVAGATSSSGNAKLLLAEIAKKAKAGDTTVAVIDNAVQ